MTAPSSPEQFELPAPADTPQASWGAEPLELTVTLEVAGGCLRFEWHRSGSPTPVAHGHLTPWPVGFLYPLFVFDWKLETATGTEQDKCGTRGTSASAFVNRLRKRFPVPDHAVQVRVVPDSELDSENPGAARTIALPPGESPWKWLGHAVHQFGRFLEVTTEIMGGDSPQRGPAAARSLAAVWLGIPGVTEADGDEPGLFPPPQQNIQGIAAATRIRFSPLGKLVNDMDPLTRAEMEREERRFLRKEQKRAEEEQRRQETMARLAEERRRREERAAIQRKIAEANRAAEQIKALARQARPPSERPPLPPVPTHLELPRLEFQETTFPLANLDGYSLRERAALWWISNQSDDLLCLPYCRVERLEYQLRTALRVLGPLRGRALLSDEVGLGKTIEAGLVLKELLTRGMVKRFLVLTVPSLVDQWEEELSDKFGLTTVTTNHASARGDTEKFWRENPGLVASLHTLKQPAQLEIARQVHWDILIVDEAHYLRNRDSLAWQAVNALPRQFLLLLTATPVQNSLEELYNLVTLLQPGQLPTPKEFRARFLDPKRPRQPREPEELRRLLGQVMIRNTRANAGINLPPRRAETVLFEPDEAERAFWQQWETEFRACLAQLSSSQASLWGRLLLQAAGSSAAAWREALEEVPGSGRRPRLGASRRRWKQAGGASANCSSRSRAGRAGRSSSLSFYRPRPRWPSICAGPGWKPSSSTARLPRPSASRSRKISARGAARCCSPTAAPKDATCSSPIAWPISTCRGTRWKSSSALAGSIAWARSTQSTSTTLCRPARSRSTCCKSSRRSSTSLSWSWVKPGWSWGNASAATNSPKKCCAAGARAMGASPRRWPGWAMN